MKTTQYQPRYSGNLSKAFWLRVLAVPRSEDYSEVYSLGCALQDLEQRVLAALARAEGKRK